MNIDFSIQDICNSPGFFKNFRLIPVDHVSTFPRSSQMKLISPITLKAGRNWFSVYTTDPPVINIDEESSQQGTIYNISIFGKHPKIKTSKLAASIIMNNRRFIVEAKTTNGDIIYFGTLQQPLILRSKPTFAPYNGFELSFKGKNRYPFLVL